MRYLFFIGLSLAIPGFALATCTEPNVQNKQSLPSLDISAGNPGQKGITPQKHRFFNRVAEIILAKRLKKIVKSLDSSNGEKVEWLSLMGFSCSILGGIFLLAASTPFGIVMMAVMTLLSLILCIIGLSIGYPREKRWAKGLALAGIVVSSLVILFLIFGLLLLLAFLNALTA